MAFLNDLNQMFSIVDPNTGKPTDYFMRLIRDRGQDTITIEQQVTNLTETVTSIDGTVFTAGTGLSGGGTLGTDDPITFDLNATLDNLTDVDTSTTAPTDGQALVWVDADSLWKPGDVASGGGGGGPTAFVEFTAANPPVIVNSSGVTSVTRNAAGRYRITFSSAMSNAEYGMAAHGRFATASSDNVPPIGVDRRSGFGKTTTTIDITVNDQSGNSVESGYVNCYFFDANSSSSSGGSSINKITGSNLDLSSATTTGWTITNASMVTSDGGLTPYIGTHFLFGLTAADMSAVQELDVSSFSSKIDSDKAIFKANMKYANNVSGIEATRIAFTPLDGPSGTATGPKVIAATRQSTTEDTWLYLEVEDELPSGTRTVLLEVGATRREGSVINTGITDVKPYVITF